MTSRKEKKMDPSKIGSIKIARIGAWSDHPSALGNEFSVHNAEQFLSSVAQIFQSRDVGSFLGKVCSPFSAICSGWRVPQWICASVNIVFVRWKSLYFPRQVPSFLHQQQQCHISEFTGPYPRSLQRSWGHNGGTSNGSWEPRKATQSTVPRCPLPILPNKGQEQQNHHHDHKYFVDEINATKG